jgi:hypothetical protein
MPINYYDDKTGRKVGGYFKWNAHKVGRTGSLGTNEPTNQPFGGSAGKDGCGRAGAHWSGATRAAKTLIMCSLGVGLSEMKSVQSEALSEFFA